MEWSSHLSNATAAVAIIFAVREFLNHIADQRRIDRELWSNHLSRSIEAEQKTASILDRLVDEIRSLRRL